ncbi:Uncharacterized protein QTN25_010075 [Entamoeba marina]
MDPHYQIILNCVIVGDAECGKTSFFNSLKDNPQIHNDRITIGPEFFVKEFIINDISYLIYIFNRAGSERFITTIKNYYHSADVCFLLYDITNKKSFENIDFWYAHSKKNVDKYDQPFCYVLIGNKCELVNKRKVPYEEAKLYAKQHNMYFFEISVYQDINVSSFINILLTKLIHNHSKELPEKTSTDDNFTIQPIPEKKSSCFIV